MREIVAYRHGNGGPERKKKSRLRGKDVGTGDLI